MKLKRLTVSSYESWDTYKTFKSDIFIFDENECIIKEFEFDYYKDGYKEVATGYFMNQKVVILSDIVECCDMNMFSEGAIKSYTIDVIESINNATHYKED